MNYGLLWILWVVAFFAIEIPAWKDGRPGGTLSEYIWSIFAIRVKGPGWVMRRTVLLIALGSLGYHFMAGGGWLIFD